VNTPYRQAAFPIHPRSQVMGADFNGMDKREFIATLVYPEMIHMVALAATHAAFDEPAKLAVKYADALIAEIQKTNGGPTP
jgi:hypothetical protein